MATHKFILSMGHRNTNKGGANGEYAWTPGATRALRDAIVARGGEAYIIQEERGTGEFYNGGLQAAASACVELAKTKGPFKAYISSHYNGGGSPGFHAIFPDARSGEDTKANNSLDVKLARAIRDRVKATNTVRMLSWTADSPGVMSEKETGVGEQGYRLGEMVGTIGFRDQTARVIIEASSIDVASERTYINSPQWVRNVYSEAIVDALEDVFGKFAGQGNKPIPAPDPEPEKPSQFARPIFRPELDQFKTREPAATPQAIRVGDVWWNFFDRDVQAVKATPRLRDIKGEDKVGGDIASGETFYVWFSTVANGELYGYTKWGTIVRLSDTDLGVRR